MKKEIAVGIIALGLIVSVGYLAFEVHSLKQVSCNCEENFTETFIENNFDDNFIIEKIIELETGLIKAEERIILLNQSSQYLDKRMDKYHEEEKVKPIILIGGGWN